MGYINVFAAITITRLFLGKTDELIIEKNFTCHYNIDLPSYKTAFASPKNFPPIYEYMCNAFPLFYW